jgi:hypothetical protein
MGLGVLRKVCSYFRTYFIPLLKQSSNPRTAFIKKRCEAWVARMVPLTQTLPNKIIFPVTVKNRTKACNFETVLVSVVSQYETVEDTDALTGPSLDTTYSYYITTLQNRERMIAPVDIVPKIITTLYS